MGGAIASALAQSGSWSLTLYDIDKDRPSRLRT